MSLVLIARALEKRLGTLTPAVDIAAENGTYQPKTGVPYQALALLPADTDTPTLSQGYEVETGFFQVTVCYPSAGGPVAARTRAQLIRDHFDKDLVLTESGVIVEIIRKPSIAPAQSVSGWYCIPVRIFYKAVISR